MRRRIRIQTPRNPLQHLRERLLLVVLRLSAPDATLRREHECSSGAGGAATLFLPEETREDAVSLGDDVREGGRGGRRGEDLEGEVEC